MVDECLIKKVVPYSTFQEFWLYNDKFYEKCAKSLEKRAEDLDLNQTMTVLINGNVTHLKRHAQIRIMYEFMMKGVKTIKKERHYLGGRYDLICWHYYKIGRRYCHGNPQKKKLDQAFYDIGVDIERLREQNLNEPLRLPRKRGINSNVITRDTEWFEKAAEVYGEQPE